MYSNACPLIGHKNYIQGFTQIVLFPNKLTSCYKAESLLGRKTQPGNPQLLAPTCRTKSSLIQVFTSAKNKDMYVKTLKSHCGIPIEDTIRIFLQWGPDDTSPTKLKDPFDHWSHIWNSCLNLYSWASGKSGHYFHWKLQPISKEWYVSVCWWKTIK